MQYTVSKSEGYFTAWVLTLLSKKTFQGKVRSSVIYISSIDLDYT